MGIVINITDEQKRPIAGAVYLYDADGIFMSRIDVPATGVEIPDYVVDGARTFQVDSPGYIGYAVLQLDAVNNFLLVPEPKITGVAVGLLILFFAGKFFKVF